MLTFTLVDPSLADGMKFCVFAETEDQLPYIKNTGDIVRIHRIKVLQKTEVKVQVKLYGSKFTGMGSRSTGCACLVIDVFGTARYSSRTITFNHTDKERIKALKAWLERNRNFLNTKAQKHAQISEVSFSSNAL